MGDGGAASDSDKLTSGVPSPGRPTFKQHPARSLAWSNSVTLDKSMAHLNRKGPRIHTPLGLPLPDTPDTMTRPAAYHGGTALASVV